MPFEISPEELQEMARLEEEAGCDVEAGLDWGRSGGAYLAATESCLGQELGGEARENSDSFDCDTEPGEH